MQAVFMVPFNYNLEKNVEALKRQCDKAEKAFNTVITIAITTASMTMSQQMSVNEA